MKLRKYWLLLPLMFTVNIGLADEPDWTAYRALLQSVHPGMKHGAKLNLVDYAALKQHADLSQAYQALSSFDLSRLQTREEKLAFYINAYNLLALKLVVDHWPVTSIKDIGSIIFPVWYKHAGSLGGENITLDKIEHHILRPMGDTRIHMAIVCASVSCPNLRREPYSAAKLNQQLNAQTLEFLNNSGKGLTIEKYTIRISQLFDWFDEDFEHNGGVRTFLKQYQPNLPDLPIKADLPYDWDVNG